MTQLLKYVKIKRPKIEDMFFVLFNQYVENIKCMNVIDCTMFNLKKITKH